MNRDRLVFAIAGSLILTRIIHEIRFEFERGSEGEAVYPHTANPQRQSSGANMNSPLVKKFR